MTQAGMKESQEVETVPSHNMDHGYEEEEDEPLVRRRPTMAKALAAPTATTSSALPLASAEVESGPRQFPQPSPRAKSLSEPSPESLRAPQKDSAKESEAPQQHSERNDGQTEGSPAKSTPLEFMSVEPEEALSRPRIQATPQVELAIPKTVVQSRKELEAAKKEVHPVVPEVAVKTLQAAPEVQQLPRKVAPRPRSSTPRDPPELRKTRTGAMVSKRLSVEAFEVPDDDPPLPKPRRTPVQNKSAAEKFYAARAEKSAKLQQDQEGSEGQVRLTQDQLVEYLRFQYKDDIRKLCVLGLLRPLQAVDILDACSGDFIAAKTLVRKGMTEHEKVAYIRLAPPGYRYVEQSYSTDWVRDCVRKGHLITLNDAMGYRLKLANKQDKTHYTIEDDNILRRFIAEKIASGAKINGKKIYQELAAAHPRHTMESWRTRATKELRLTETPSPSPYAASKALRDQISVARNLTLRGMAAQPPSPPGATPTPKNRLTMAQDSKSTSHVSAGQSSQRGDSSQAISSCPSPAPRSSDPPPLTPPALDPSMNRLPTSLTSSRGLPSMDLSSFNLPSSSTRDISGSQVIKPRLEDLLHVSDFSSDDEEEAMRIKEVQTPSQRRKGPRSDPHDVASATKNSTTADIAVAKTVTLSLISPPIQEESGDKPISAPEPIVMLSPDLVPAIATTDPTLTLPSTALTEPDDIAIAQGIIQRMASVSPEVQEEHEGLEDMDLEVPAGQIFQEDHQELEDEVLLEGQPSSEDHMKLVEELFPEGESFTEPHRELEEDLAQPEFDSLPQDDFSLEEPRSLEDQELLRRSHSQQSWVSPSKSSTSLSAEHDMDRSSPAFSSQDGLDSGAEVQVPEKFFTGHLRKKKPRIPGRPKNIKYGLTRASATGIPATESTATSARLSMVGTSEQALPPTAKSLGPNSHASNEDNALDMENIMEEPERLQTTILENTNGIELQSVDDLDGLSEDDANIASRILDRHRGSVPSVSSSIALDTY
ncbi:hypothetical protein CPC16_004988, partial [Podila verticillata]